MYSNENDVCGAESIKGVNVEMWYTTHVSVGLQMSAVGLKM